MKKMLIGFLIVAAGLAQAESVIVSLTATNSQTVYSDALAVHGYIDRIEYYKTGNSSGDVVVATFEGTTAIDTFLNKQNLAAGTQSGVVRTRFIGTGNTGTALAGVATDNTNASVAVTTVLQAAYEKPLVGGNVKLKLTNDESTNITAKVTIFFDPVKR
jgi:hypothetical protein